MDLTWLSTAADSTDHTVSIQLRSAEGQLVAQSDSPPLGGGMPTSAWDPGDVIHDAMVVAIPVEAPPQLYVDVVVYEPQTGERLTATNGDFMGLGTLEMTER